MLSVETRDVSRAPGRDVWNIWNTKSLGSCVPDEDAVDPEVLRPDVRAQIRPLRILGIGGRLRRIRSDMTEAARHSDAVGLHETIWSCSSLGSL